MVVRKISERRIKKVFLYWTKLAYDEGNMELVEILRRIWTQIICGLEKNKK